jgi:hypothetical protein
MIVSTDAQYSVASSIPARSACVGGLICYQTEFISEIFAVVETSGPGNVLHQFVAIHFNVRYVFRTFIISREFEHPVENGIESQRMVLIRMHNGRFCSKSLDLSRDNRYNPASAPSILNDLYLIHFKATLLSVKGGGDPLDKILN